MRFDPPAWYAEAACRPYGDLRDGNPFFYSEDEPQPVRDEKLRVAKLVCSGCQAFVECVEWASSLPFSVVEYGVWHGESAQTRRKRLTGRRGRMDLSA